MTKPLEPYKCASVVNYDIVGSISSIAYKIGKLSVVSEGKHPEPDTVEMARYALQMMGKELTPSQIRGLRLGEDIYKCPEAKLLVELYERQGKADPYFKDVLGDFEKALFPAGTPNRLSRKVASFPYSIPMHAKIEPMMNGLFDFAKKSKEKVHPLLLGSLLYFMVLAIEPYSNGNNVLASYLFRLFVCSYHRDLGSLPLEKIIVNNQKALDEAYECSVNSGNTAPFVSELLSLLDKAVDSLCRSTSRAGKGVSASVERMLSLMEEGRFYSAAELCNMLGLKSRLGLQRNYLQKGIATGLLEMSNPLCPTDRTQRYRKKVQQ